MRCTDTRKVLSRYLDHELSQTETASVEEHLAQCLECRTEHATQQRLWTLLGRAEPIRSPDFIAAVEARLSAPRGWTAFLDGLRLRAVGYAAVAAILVGLFVWTGVWAGTVHRDPDVREHDRTFAEILSDTPPGMEIEAVLDQIGERP